LLSLLEPPYLLDIKLLLNKLLLNL